jgi:hypothetical protein
VSPSPLPWIKVIPDAAENTSTSLVAIGSGQGVIL